VIRCIDNLSEVADRFDAIVLDQWGVLHDGTRPYAGAIAALERLQARGTRLAVLSNSGKRAAPNMARIAAMGFDPALFEIVMTSGEALWRDIADGKLPARRMCPIERAPGDAAQWADGLPVTLNGDPAQADAILLMGLPDVGDLGAYDAVLQVALAQALPVLCTNPDRASPRSGGVTVVSPGALANAHAKAGGTVRFYGKPHAPVFDAVADAMALPPGRIAMVGDSLEHDIAGAKSAGWSAIFVQNGLHAAAFTDDATPDTITAPLAATDAAPLPDFTLPELC